MLMLYHDTVESEMLVHKPWFIGCIFTIVLACFLIVDVTSATMGELLRPLIGDHAQVKFYSRIAIAFVIAAMFCLNLVLIGFVPLKIQIGIVWFQLMLLFLSLFAAFDLSMPFIWENLPFLITQGVVTTVYVSAMSLLFASAIAIIGAIAKLSSNGMAYAIVSFYTSCFRGLPLLMQVYLIYMGLPQVGYVINAVPAGVLALSLCSGAYMTEIFRSGIASIDRGQWEASRSLGFGFALTMRRIILPQALPVIIPPMGNTFISMLKDSSLVSVLGVWELTYLAHSLGQPTFHTMEMLVTAAMIYWILSACLELVQSRIEDHFARSKKR
jgi:polar amino acid transport system permease protein